jgi:hypothetical protein
MKLEENIMFLEARNAILLAARLCSSYGALHEYTLTALDVIAVTGM